MTDQMRRSQARIACQEDEGCLMGPGQLEEKGLKRTRMLLRKKTPGN